MDIAIRDNDHISQEFLHWFVNEQLEETSTLNTLLVTIRRVDKMLLLQKISWQGTPLLNNKIGKSLYTSLFNMKQAPHFWRLLVFHHFIGSIFFFSFFLFLF